MGFLNDFIGVRDTAQERREHHVVERFGRLLEFVKITLENRHSVPHFRHHVVAFIHQFSIRLNRNPVANFRPIKEIHVDADARPDFKDSTVDAFEQFVFCIFQHLACGNQDISREFFKATKLFGFFHKIASWFRFIVSPD